MRNTALCLKHVEAKFVLKACRSKTCIEIYIYIFLERVCVYTREKVGEEAEEEREP